MDQIQPANKSGAVNSCANASSMTSKRTGFSASKNELINVPRPGITILSKKHE